MNARSFALALLATGAILLLLPASVAADITIRQGVRGGYAFNASALTAAYELVFTRVAPLSGNPSLEYVFAADATRLLLNLDLHYDRPLPSRVLVWMGGGLATIYQRPEGGEASFDFGLNLILGAGLLLPRNWMPNLEVRATFADETEVLVAAGVRF